jgi:putative tributyrin esterase
MPMKDLSFYGKSVAREVSYRVLLPSRYEDGQQRFPVLYLLHGLYGDRTNWSELTKLTEYARSLDLIIVMPDAGNSWYANSFTNPNDRYDDFIIQDLISEIETKYRILASRSARAIAGLSMGGYGSLKFALKYPSLFCFAGSMTGALSAPLNLGDEVEEFREGLLKAFGPSDDLRRERNDVFSLARIAAPGRLPYIYLDCGAQDSFLVINRRFASLLQSRGISYEYHELPGGHEWQYWDGRLSTLLEVLQSKIQASPGIAASS